MQIGTTVQVVDSSLMYDGEIGVIIDFSPGSEWGEWLVKHYTDNSLKFYDEDQLQDEDAPKDPDPDWNRD